MVQVQVHKIEIQAKLEVEMPIITYNLTWYVTFGKELHNGKKYETENIYYYNIFHIYVNGQQHSSWKQYDNCR